jgi:hypothetical protein
LPSPLPVKLINGHDKSKLQGAASEGSTVTPFPSIHQPDPRMADEVPGVADKEVIIDTAADSFVALSTSCNDVSGIFVEAVDDETERFMPIHWPSSYFLEPHTPAPPSPPKSIIGTRVMPKNALEVIFLFVCDASVLGLSTLSSVCRRWSVASFNLYKDVTVFPHMAGDIKNNNQHLWVRLANFLKGSTRGQHARSFTLVDQTLRQQFLKHNTSSQIRLWDVIFVTRGLSFLTCMDVRGVCAKDFSTGEPFLLSLVQSNKALQTLKMDRSCVTANGGTHIWVDVLLELRDLRHLTLGSKYTQYLADDALDVPDNAQQLLERLYIFKMYAPLTSASLGKLFTFSAPKLRALAVNCSVAHYALAIEPEVSTRMPKLQKLVITQAVYFAVMFRILLAVKGPELHTIKFGGWLCGSATRMERSLLASLMKTEQDLAVESKKAKGAPGKVDAKAMDKKGIAKLDTQDSWVLPGFTPCLQSTYPLGTCAVVGMVDPRNPVKPKKGHGNKKKKEEMLCRPMFPFDLGMEESAFENALASTTSLAFRDIALDRIDAKFPLRNLTSLNLSHNYLQDTTILLETLNSQSPGLVSLDLSANLLKSLDGSIGKLKDLKILRLQDNLLPKIPSTLAHLTKLKCLDVSNNKLTSLPSIHHLTSLQELFLDCNAIGVPLTKLFTRCTKLQALGLRSTEMTVLPSEIGRLQKLTFLDLSHNMLDMLPKELGTLPLRRLDLRENGLAAFIPIPEACSEMLWEHGPARLRSAFDNLRLWLTEDSENRAFAVESALPVIW